MTRLFWPALFILPLALVATACEIKDDTEYFNQLSELRVLGVKSEPADLARGETATLSALVYAPGDPEVSYEWSWCPARNGPDGGFTCALDEEQLRAIWADMGMDGEPPPYDLGTGQTAEVANVFTLEAILGLCDALVADSASDPMAILECLSGLDFSVRLRVSTAPEDGLAAVGGTPSSGQEVVALKSIPLVFEEGSGQRNSNPDPSGPIRVRNDRDSILKADDEPLRLGEVYRLRAGFDSSQAEDFFAENVDGELEEVPRRETLVMTWFVTMGSTVVDGEGRFGDGERTSFLDGSKSFDEILENKWELPFEDGRDEARLFLVIRDERGGLGWVEHRFTVGAAQ